jgi:hypothetical protein
MPTVDQLYCLPKRYSADSNLQKVISEAMEELQYCAPISGNNQQTVQSADLDGDGKDEYLLFAKDNSEKPLKILIFSEIALGYVLMDTIEGYGFAFEFVEYANVDDRPGLDIIVGRQVSEQVVRSISVYRFASGFSRQLMSASYSRVITTDFDGNGREDLFLIHPGQTEDSPASAVLYSFKDDEIRRSAEVSLSAPALDLKRVALGKLLDGTQAVFASSALDENFLVTDILSAADHRVVPLEMNISTPTLNNYYLYPQDIDQDGYMEMPTLRQLQVPDETKSQFCIDWYNPDPAGDGELKLSTYHNFDEGWYYRLDPAWQQDITVLEEEDRYTFGLLEGKKDRVSPIFTIWVLTGPDREEQAVLDGRILLHKGETEVYAMSFAEELDEAAQRQLLERFRLIRTDWNTEDDREDEDEKGTDSGR